MYGRILVALDSSDSARMALEEAIRLAQATPGATLRLVTVIEIPGALLTAEGVSEVGVERSQLRVAEQVLAAGAAAARGAGVEAETAAPEALGTSAADTIVEEAERWNADIIVIGTHGRRGFRRLVLGSVADGVARRADRPVLLVPLHRATEQK